jgi:hypothetical protein
MATVSGTNFVGSQMANSPLISTALRLVDNKAILYFDAPSPSDALNWYRGIVIQQSPLSAPYLNDFHSAINLHIPDSKA